MSKKIWTIPFLLEVSLLLISGIIMVISFFIVGFVGHEVFGISISTYFLLGMGVLFGMIFLILIIYPNTN